MIRNALQRFMYGRYGNDQQNTALLAHPAVDLLMTRIARFSLPSRHREVPVKLNIRHSAK